MEKGKEDPASAAVDVPKFAAPKAATIGREEGRGYANSGLRMYILPFALTFSLYSLSLFLSLHYSSVYDDQFRPSAAADAAAAAPLFLWECAAIIHSQSKLLACLDVSGSASGWGLEIELFLPRRLIVELHTLEGFIWHSRAT